MAEAGCGHPLSHLSRARAYLIRVILTNDRSFNLVPLWWFRHQLWIQNAESSFIDEAELCAVTISYGRVLKIDLRRKQFGTSRTKHHRVQQPEIHLAESKHCKGDGEKSVVVATGSSRLSKIGFVMYMRGGLTVRLNMRIRLKSANSQFRMNQKCCISLYQLHKVDMNGNVQDSFFQASSPS